MGPGAESLMCRKRKNQTQILVNFSGGRTAVINVYVKAATPYLATITTTKETSMIKIDGASIFSSTLSAILDMFDSGKPSVDWRETLAIRGILDAAMKPAALRRFINVYQ